MTIYTPRVFLNYRTGDTGAEASRLASDIERLCGPESVFIDHAGIRGSQVWRERLFDELERASAMICLIGEDWARSFLRDSDAEDWVRAEIERALERRIPMLPVLVDAERPRITEVPAAVRPLFEWQTRPLRRLEWDDDVERLLESLDLLKAQAAAERAPLHDASFWRTRREMKLYLDHVIEDMRSRNADASQDAGDENQPGLDRDDDSDVAAYSEPFVDPEADLRPDATPSVADYPRRRGRLLAARRVRPAIAEVTAASIGAQGVTSSSDLVGLQSRTVYSVLKVLRRSSRPIVLLGEPGSGKSAALRELAIQLAGRARFVYRAPIPIYRELGTFKEPLSHAVHDTVLEFVRDGIPSGLRHLRRELGSGAGPRTFVVLFDALDEMPRLGDYARRTAALASFAEEYALVMRTVFACRTNDFDPEFGHRQLVLKPFDEKRIRIFLRGSLGRRFVVENERQSPKTAARHLMRPDELGSEAGNPLTLSLAAGFIRHQRRWPRGRISLFEDHVAALADRAHRRFHDSRRLAQRQPSDETIKQTVAAWSKLAYAIFRRHGAVSLAAEVLVEETGDREAIALAQSGGLIIEDRLSGDLRIRHHRLQEFLVAYRLHQPDPPRPDWSAILVSPRWQETLLNYFALGGRDPEALEIVTAPLLELDSYVARLEKLVETAKARVSGQKEALKALEALAKQEAAEKEPEESSSEVTEVEDGPGSSTEASEEEQEASPHEVEIEQAKARLGRAERRFEKVQALAKKRFDPDRESAWSDQAHFAARLSARLEGDGQDELRAPLRRAVEILLDRGRPPAKVRMLSAWGHLSSWCPTKMLDEVRDSPIDWVRAQAIHALVSTDLDFDRVDHAFAEELEWETLNLRLPGKLSLFKESAVLRPVRRWKLALARLTHRLYWLLVAGLLVITSLAMQPTVAELWTPLGQIRNAIWPAVWVAIVGFGAALTTPLRLGPVSLRLVWANSALGGIVLGRLAYLNHPAAAAAETTESFEPLLAQLIVLAWFVGPALVTAAALWVLFWTFRLIMRGRSQRGDTLLVGRHPEESLSLGTAGALIKISLWLVGLGAGLAALISPLGLFGVGLVLVYLLLLGVARFIPWFVNNFRESWAEHQGFFLWRLARVLIDGAVSTIHGFLVAAGCLIVITIVFGVVPAIFSSIFDTILGWIPKGSLDGAEFAFGGVVILVFFLFIALIVGSYLVLAIGTSFSQLRFRLLQRRIDQRVYQGSLDEWTADFEAASEVRRRELLAALKPRAMGVPVSDALEVLYPLEALISDDQPVASDFYRTMHTLQEADRQQRWTALERPKDETPG